MTLTIELPNDVYKKVEERAIAEGTTPEALVTTYVVEMNKEEIGDDFDQLADYLLNKNAELYRRLA